MRLPLHRWVAVVLCSVAFLAARPAQAAEPEGIATADELRQLFADGKYQPLLQKLARVLALKGAAAAPYDMVELNVLKADTFIQLKQQQQAVTALNDAAKAITPQTDPKLAAKVRAQQILIKQSSAFAYTPKSVAGSKPIPLADMSQRKAAYDALLADMQAEVAKRVKAAQSSKSLPPIITAVQGLADLGAVEMTSTGTDTISMKSADELAGGAQRLMQESVASMASRAGTIDKQANELIPNPIREQTVYSRRGERGGAVARNVPQEQTYHKKGLTSPLRNELRDIAETCEKVVDACKEFEAVSKKHAEGFRKVAEQASQTGRSASDTMTADYTGDYSAREAKK